MEKLLSVILILLLATSLSSCKSLRTDSEEKLVTSSDGDDSFEERLKGLIEIFNWIDGKAKTFDFPARQFKTTANIVDGQVQLHQSPEANLKFQKNYEEFFAISHLNIPRFYSHNYGKYSGVEKKAITTKTIIEKISFKNRVRHLSKGLLLGWMPQKQFIIDQARSFFTRWLMREGIRFFSKEEIESSFQKLLHLVDKNNQSSGSLVQYDGNVGYYHFKDPQILEATIVVASSIMTNPDTVIPWIKSFKNSSKLFQDSNTMSELSRVEPFDLVASIVSALVHRIKEQYEIKKEIDSFVTMSLKREFGIEIPSKESIYLHKDNDLILSYCYRPAYFGKHILFDVTEHKKKYIFNSNQRSEDLKITCNHKTYTLQAESTKRKRLQHPMPFEQVIKDKAGPVKITLYATLAKEISPWYISGFLVAAELYGYNIKYDRQVSAKKHFDKNLKETDMLIYAGHVLSAYNLEIGSQKNRVITLSGEKQGHDVEIEIIIPDEGPSVHIKKTELEASYYNRAMNRKKESPLFVFATSCISQSNILMWPAIHREALKSTQGFATRKDLPYVIATNRSFGTSSSYEILSHIYYPLDVIDLTLAGKSVDYIYHYLEKKEYGDLKEEAYKRSGPIGKAAINTYDFIIATQKSIKDFFKQDKETAGKSARKRYNKYVIEKRKEKFSPVYNFSKENTETTLTIGGLNVILTNPKNEILYRFQL